MDSGAAPPGAPAFRLHLAKAGSEVLVGYRSSALCKTACAAPEGAREIKSRLPSAQPPQPAQKRRGLGAPVRAGLSSCAPTALGPCHRRSNCSVQTLLLNCPALGEVEGTGHANAKGERGGARSPCLTNGAVAGQRCHPTALQPLPTAGLPRAPIHADRL